MAVAASAPFAFTAAAFATTAVAAVFLAVAASAPFAFTAAAFATTAAVAVFLAVAEAVVAAVVFAAAAGFAAPAAVFTLAVAETFVLFALAFTKGATRALAIPFEALTRSVDFTVVAP